MSRVSQNKINKSLNQPKPHVFVRCLLCQRNMFFTEPPSGVVVNLGQWPASKVSWLNPGPQENSDLSRDFCRKTWICSRGPIFVWKDMLGSINSHCFPWICLFQVIFSLCHCKSVPLLVGDVLRIRSHGIHHHQKNTIQENMFGTFAKHPTSKSKKKKLYLDVPLEVRIKG